MKNINILKNNIKIDYSDKVNKIEEMVYLNMSELERINTIDMNVLKITETTINELIKTDIVNEDALHDIVNNSYLFFRNYIPDVKIVTTDEGFDIMYENIELGSYGIRECEFLKWIYGTGCAEPRLSKAIKKYKDGISQNKY
jgi:hypothetical protein